jgi:hypothetical protein
MEPIAPGWMAPPFIPRSENKPNGTGDFAERRFALAVDRRAVKSEETQMTNRFLISVAAAALIAGSGFANAQGTGGGAGAGSAGGGAAQSAPSTGSGSMGSERGAPSAVPMNRNDGSESRGSDSMKSTQSDEKMAPGSKNQRAQESTPGQKSGTTASDSHDRAGKDMKEEDRGNAADRNNRNADSKTGDRSSTTTGQAGAGAKLSTEQRTRITTVIKNQNIRPQTNVNFSISVGTRVPRDVRFHPLPAEIVTVYPDWRGYEFILVNDQIVVVNPRTLEIVAVIDA